MGLISSSGLIMPLVSMCGYPCLANQHMLKNYTCSLKLTKDVNIEKIGDDELDIDRNHMYVG
jgi:hypothetical protein